jgi:hypothetical protein
VITSVHAVGIGIVPKQLVEQGTDKIVAGGHDQNSQVGVIVMLMTQLA